jgi:hypothetical protein
MGFKMALPLNLVGDGLQPAKSGRSVCEYRRLLAAVRGSPDYCGSS